MITQVINNYENNFLRIEYMLGNICNYKCSYCFPGSNEGTIKWPDVDVVKTNFSHLLDRYVSKGRDTFELYLIGGEPTIWKNLPELIEFLKKRYDISIHISTNASCSPNWWKRNVKYFDHIDISVHHEAADIAHIIDVSDTIYEEQIPAVANVLMDPNHFDKCKDIIEELLNSKHSWPIVAKSVHYNGETRYTNEQTKYFDERVKRYPDMHRYLEKLKKNKKVWVISKEGNKESVPNDSWFALNRLNYFNGWECNLGIEYIKIFPTGEITGNCRQPIYGKKDYFNLYDNNFCVDFMPELIPVICRTPICSCSGEIILNKRRV
jgi:organic radical activating enzyme